MQFLPHTYLLYMTAVFYGILAVVTFARKRTPITMFFGMMLVLSGIWAATYSAELDAPQLTDKIYWMKFRLIFTPYLGAAWLAFALAISGMFRSFNRWFWLAILVYPYITTSLALTGWFPEYFRSDYIIVHFHGLKMLSYTSGLWNTIHELTFHATSLLGFLVLLSAWHSSSPLLRKQIVLLSVAYVLPTFGNLIYTYNLFPDLGINPAPFILLPSTVLLAYVVFRYRVLDLVPIARSMILDHMNDGLVVLDSFGLVVDINSVAEKWTQIKGMDVLGLHPKDFPEPWDGFLTQSIDTENTYRTETAHSARWFTCKGIPIADISTEVKGTLILIRDTTVENLHRIVHEQNQQRDVELKQLQMQKLLTRDIHDGLGGLAANMALVATLARKEGEIDKKNEWLDKLQLLVGEANVEIRELMNSLECNTLGWPDIIDAIRRVSGVMFDDRTADVKLQIDGIPPSEDPDMTAGMSIIRIAKECMNNIVKHAEADTIRIGLNFTPESFRLFVWDNGKGFDLETIRRGRGLDNLEKRSMELGGTIQLETDDGTRVEISIPLPIISKTEEEEESSP
ncbi:MAG: PAS domain-containing protein [Kiritimatiellaceae bacterium]|nr:PAS domain-containing protein [Kiritimatiellaceae bacterium]